MKTFAKTVIALVVCGLWVVGCDRSGGKTLKLAFVTNNASEFWKIAAAGVHKYEKEAGVQVDIKMPPNGKVEEQNQILENLVTQGYNGIAVSAIAPQDQVGEINKAAAKTIVICHDSDAPKSNRKLYIGTNNFEAGRALGMEIVKLLPKGGKMAVFVGTLSADNASQRLRGIEEAIKGHSIEIVAKKEDETDRVKARTNVEGVINGFSDINLLCGLWSYNGPQIASAIESSGKKGKILAAVFDEEDETLSGIEKGVVSVTVVQKPFMFGYLSAKHLHELNTKGDAAIPKGGVVDTGVEVITAGNVKEFKARLAEMKK
ncbi:MAG TPA: sugar-binding protein [Tepidisphaeraceae bacterium]|nr:sugar-binding protein [Tepidisphaeraceae bacterium]